MSWQKEVDEINARLARTLEQGGEEGVSRQHNQGRLTLRERFNALLDLGSFQEIGRGAGFADEAADEAFTPANFLLGFGTIDGRRVIVGGEDFTLKGGSPSASGLRKSIYAEDLALQYKVPLIRLHEGGGGSVGGKGRSMGSPVYEVPRFRSVARAMATVPVATAALGPVAGLPASRLVAAHFSVMSKETAQVLIAGPAVVERALGEKKTKEELGDYNVHTKNGVVDNAAEDEPDALGQIRQFLGYLPQNVWELAPRIETGDAPDRCEEALIDIIPRDRRKGYNIRRLLDHIVDEGTFFEFGKGYGRGQVTGLARLHGQSVGILSNDCYHLAGAMTANGAHKVRRFVELCETFHLPIASFVDEPGFMIGSASEQAGTIRYGTSAVLTVALSSVPWACVVLRKSFGVAQSAHYGPDAYTLSWPSAETGALPVEGGVAVAYRREIEAADDPDAKRREIEERLAAQLSPFPRAEDFAVHDVIDPRRTRPLLCDWVDWIQPRLPQLLGESAFPVRP